ncbi:hypothetical protein [Chroococcidiopsis cubana]|uniref:hypothetical protein n=1 Tax=Chroococcidiopsis cubana TaxID=171392 RepID=UPI002ACEB13F|nr:hypothetical protein [Chroococcidiopsis cubana]
MLSLETHKVQHRSLILTILRRSQKSEVKIEETGDRRKIRGTRGTRGIRELRTETWNVPKIRSLASDRCNGSHKQNLIERKEGEERKVA